MTYPAIAQPYDDEHWRVRSACLGMDPNMFFPTKGETPHPDAVDACARCPVRVECLEYALAAREEFGYFGGQSERGRRRILRQRFGAYGVNRPAEAKGPRRAADPDPGPGRRTHRSVASKAATGPPNRADSTRPAAASAMEDAQAMEDASPGPARRRARRAS